MGALGWDRDMSLLSQTPVEDNKKQHFRDDLSMQGELECILATKNINAVFQPIVSLTNATVIGYEALSRGPQGSSLEHPDTLFAAAEKYNKVWELEFLCRVKALEKAKDMVSGKMLFLNVDPNIIKDSRFQKGLTREMLSQYRMDATNIIFEITEKTSVNDYRSFRRVLDNYVSQGYKIALDDTGSGYSGLKLLAETRPQFVKIDMDLVRDIDKDALKQALMKAFYEFSLVTNMKIIAEGIETVDELTTLISIGIPYGQGYLLQRPAPEFLAILPKIKEMILARNQIKRQETLHTALTMPVGEMVRKDNPFLPSARGGQVLEHFHANPNLTGIPVVLDGKPVGLLMKDKFFMHLATQYGVALYMNRPIQLIIDRNPLIVEYATPLEQVSKLAISRPEDSLYDYIIVSKDNKYYGITTVRNLLAKTTQLEINRAKYANPLSGLPGNIIIEHKLTQLIEAKQPFTVLYFDLDNFKAYNDVYGFDNGDKVIAATASIIQQQLAVMAGTHSFLGHIGGDDFIVVLPNMHIDAVCCVILQAFDRKIRDYYNEQDRQRGFIISKNRHGIEEKFPLVTLSIAVVKNDGMAFQSLSALAETAGIVKKRCKLVWRSCYCVGEDGEVNTKFTLC